MFLVLIGRLGDLPGVQYKISQTKRTSQLLTGNNRQSALTPFFSTKMAW